MIIKNIPCDKNTDISEINFDINTVNFSAYVDISFKNNTDKKIVAVKFNARGYNLFEEIVHVNNSPIFHIILENLSVEPSAYFLPKQILLPDNSIVKIEIAEFEVFFSDDSTALCDGENIIAK